MDLGGDDVKYFKAKEIWTWSAIVSEEGDWGAMTRNFKIELLNKLTVEKIFAIRCIDGFYC